MEDEDHIELVDEVVENLSNSTARLITITHWDKGAWIKHYIPGHIGIKIPNEDIRQEYEERLNGIRRKAQNT